MGTLLSTIGTVDIVALVILIFFIVLGLIKGFTWQVMRVVTILVGMAVARSLSPSFSSWMQGSFASLKGKSYSIYISYFIIFLGVFIVGTLFAIMFGKILKNLKLRAYDSLLGGFVGFITGGAVIIVILLFLYSVLSDQSEFRKELEASRTARYASWAITRAYPLIPPSIRKEVARAAEKAEKTIAKVKKESPASGDEEKEK